MKVAMASRQDSRRLMARSCHRRNTAARVRMRGVRMRGVSGKDARQAVRGGDKHSFRLGGRRRILSAHPAPNDDGDSGECHSPRIL
jgi:hypothetical protein